MAYFGVIFGLAQDDLRRHVDGRADARLGAGVHLVLGVPEVTDLQERPCAIPAVSIQEKIFQLQVSVCDPLHMHASRLHILCRCCR